MKARFSNIQDNFNGIKVLEKDPITRKRSLKKITDVSAFFSKFEDGTIIHFYRQPDLLPHHRASADNHNLISASLHGPYQQAGAFPRALNTTAY